MDENRSPEEPVGTGEIFLKPFQPDDQSAARSLILAGLVEHWGWLDQSKNTDLDDIATSYQGAYFLVAHQDGQVIGTGALLHITDDTSEVVRMSVAPAHRRQGVGRLILRSLLDHAKKTGMRRVILETTATWLEVIEFYKSAGFELTHFQGEDAYFRLDLPPAADPNG